MLDDKVNITSIWNISKILMSKQVEIFSKSVANVPKYLKVPNCTLLDYMEFVRIKHHGKFWGIVK